MNNNEKSRKRVKQVLQTLSGLKASEMLQILFQAANTVIEESECEVLSAKPRFMHERVCLRLSKIEANPELKDFVDAHIGKIRQKEIIKQAEERFGREVISKAGLSRYVSTYRMRQIKKNRLLGKEVD